MERMNLLYIWQPWAKLIEVGDAIAGWWEPALDGGLSQVDVEHWKHMETRKQKQRLLGVENGVLSWNNAMNHR
jgi:hypothetical protein